MVFGAKYEKCFDNCAKCEKCTDKIQALERLKDESKKNAQREEFRQETTMPLHDETKEE